MSHNNGLIEYHPIGEMDDFTDQDRIFIEVNGSPIVILRIGDNFYAIDDVCTHDQGPLGEGDLDGCQIICPRHGARFDVKTGEVLSPPAADNVRTYPIRVVGKTIEIGITKP